MPAKEPNVLTQIGCLLVVLTVFAALFVAAVVGVMVVIDKPPMEWLVFRAPSYVQQYRPSPNSPRTIADGIEYHTHPSFGLKMEGWSASMQDDGTVLVSLTVRHVSDNSEVHADWTYDPKTRIVTPANPLAAFLATMAGTG